VENILKRSESFTILACIFYLKKWYPGQSWTTLVIIYIY
jgi:hypothetical protein